MKRQEKDKIDQVQNGRLPNIPESVKPYRGYRLMEADHKKRDNDRTGDKKKSTTYTNAAGLLQYDNKTEYSLEYVFGIGAAHNFKYYNIHGYCNEIF